MRDYHLRGKAKHVDSQVVSGSEFVTKDTVTGHI